MTTTLLRVIQRWVGLSTDTKPTTDVPVGSLFYELNTGQGFIWDGANWIEDIRMMYSMWLAL